MKLKNTLALSLAAVMAAGLTACGSSADTASAASPAADSTAAESTEAAADTAAPDGDGDPTTLTVAMECAYAPYNWTQNDDANGAVEIRGSSDYAYGYDVMMAKKIGEALGQKVQIVKLDWDSLIPAVMSGDVDCVIAGQSITAERAAQVDFSDPYYYASIVTLTKKDSAYANAASVADLAGATATSQLGTIWYDTCLPQIENANILPAQETAPAMLVALNSGACDIVVTDHPTGQAALTAYPDLVMLDFGGGDGDFQVSDEDINIGISMKKGNTALKDAINEVLATMTTDDYNTMMDEGMQVLVGPTTTGASIAVADVCYTDRTFMLTPSASSTDVTAGKDNVFQVCFTDPNQGVGAADYMAENFAGAKVAIIYRNDDAYSQGIRDAFVKEAGDKGLSIVYQGTFTLDTSSDFSVQLAAAQTAGADLVFLPIYYQPASVIFAQAKAMGYAPTFFGVDGMDGILDMPGFDTTLAEGLVLMTPFCATVESSKSFVDAYVAAYGTTPNQFAADAYDGVYIVKAALEQAGCTADMSNEEICDALVSAITSLKFTGLTGTDMSWNAEGQVSKAPTAYVVKDGQYVEG